MWAGTVSEWAEALDVGPDDLSATLRRIVLDLQEAHADVLHIRAKVGDSIPDDVAVKSLRFAEMGLAVATELLTHSGWSRPMRMPSFAVSGEAKRTCTPRRCEFAIGSTVALTRTWMTRCAKLNCCSRGFA